MLWCIVHLLETNQDTLALSSAIIFNEYWIPIQGLQGRARPIIDHATQRKFGLKIGLPFHNSGDSDYIEFRELQSIREIWGKFCKNVYYFGYKRYQQPSHR